VVGFTTGSRGEVPGKKENLLQEMKMMMMMMMMIIIIIIIPGQHSIDSLQKTAILGTSHIIRKVVQAET
jgi:hypothetical protein